MTQYAASNKLTVDKAIAIATKKRQLILLMIDDYTTIHTNRRPTSLQTSNANTMCTIIVKIFPNIEAIPMKKPDEVHPKNGININQLINLICSNESMTSLVNTFATCTPELTAKFFDPLMERERLEAHDYCASADVRHLRKFDNVYLIDFLKLPLIKEHKKLSNSFRCRL
jgi:hypothetical protein